ncbi:hypothetical protein GLOIN_2v1764038 [Rhizophagus irregularis DAOM 181602=DAOM 197198]|nr:hypothetical protein GLOIN_2v1764038 [Rhizophagus irregularis DAOM 181602=DAOM 197198]
MSHSGLFEWDDFLNDQIFTGRNGKQQYNSSAAENILNSNYLNTPNIQPLERDMENQEKIQPLESDDDDDMENQEGIQPLECDDDDDDMENQEGIQPLECDDDDDDMENQEENFNSLPSFKTYDGSSHIPHYQGEYGPYFPSFTAMALFIWVTKHMISSAAYEGIESDSKSEFWHGELWQRSPLFGAECCHHNNELPRTYARSRQDSRLLWLTENQEIIELSQIINKVSVWDISLRYRHPTLSVPSEVHPDFYCRRIKIFCDLYFDNFGTYRNIYHSLGGLYLQFGNMKLTSRQKLRNHFLVGFVPFGGKFEDAIKLFIQDIQYLECGFLMTIDNEQVWVSGGLGITTADLPQGNDLAGTLRHNATYGCRTCKASRNDLTDISFDIAKHGRYHHLTNIEFKNIQCLPNISQKHTFASSLGLRLTPNPLNQLIWDRHISTPQDIFHCFAGKANRLLIATFGLLTHSGEDTFTETWKFFEVPSCWSQWQNPITHLASYFMSDILRLTMIIPFILRRNEDYETIQKMLELECKMLLEVFPEQFSGLPNLHVSRHIVAHAKTYGTAFNTSVSVKEMVHRIHKGVVPHTNKKNVEFDLIKRDNTLQTLRHLLDGGQDTRFGHNSPVHFCIQNIVNDVKLRPLLDNWYVTSSLLPKIYNDDNIEKNFTVGNHLNEYLSNELANTYAEYYKDRGAMINSKVEFYNNISYVVKDDDCFVDVRLHVGDVVDVFEEGETEESYAIIKGIFTHERSRKLHAFVIFDWFEKIGENTLLKCPKYRLQASEETRWNRIFPISLIDHNPRVHFVHNCNENCNNEKHDLTNHCYLKNMYYYLAV